MDIKEVTNWIKENFETVEFIPPLYNMGGNYSDVIYKCISGVKRAINPKEDYHKRYSVSVEDFCKQLEEHFK